MKKTVVFFTGALFLTFAVNAFAEGPGFMQRLIDRFAKKPAQATEAVKTAPVPVKEKAKPAGTAPVQKAGAALATREDFIENIKQTLSTDPGVINRVADLKIVEEGGNSSYTFKEASLESLDDKSLQDLSDKIMSEAYNIRAEAINEQLNAVRQAQQAQAQSRQAQQAQAQSRQAQQAQAQSNQAQAIGRPAGPGGPGGGRR